jgi:hypothetical protein
LVGGENPFPEPDRLRRHFHQLIVIDELDRLLQIVQARRDDAIASSAVEARMFVCFFPSSTFTSMSF